MNSKKRKHERYFKKVKKRHKKYIKQVELQRAVHNYADTVLHSSRYWGYGNISDIHNSIIKKTWKRAKIDPFFRKKLLKKYK